MRKQEFLTLLDKYLNGETSIEEEELLSKFHATYRHNEHLDDSFFTEDLRLEILSKIENRIGTHQVKVYNWRHWVAIAAAVLITLSGITYYYQRWNETTYQQIANNAENVLPGKNKALLKLANGTIITLDDSDPNTRTVLEEKGLTIQKNKDGQLLYVLRDDHTTNLMGNNTIETPRGGQYEVVLPDGTHVWLNSESSLSYNLNFKKQRKVLLKGEAYFEVAKKKVPFIVQNAIQEIRVLGTHFNVNSYREDAYSQTTLLEGQVAISTLNKDREQPILMRPNFSVSTHNTSGTSTQSEADIESVMAWKNGDFQFDDERLSTILRVIARWYDVQVDYNSLPNTRYTLQISKHVRLSDVLTMLEKTGPVKFQFQQQMLSAEK